ncbi:MAG: LLM class flavin-dependent oxidoreductase [Chromatiales bacterium]|jgi:alkanesulfonate monooxygenase SsuD/methylene tetrahydromethanopterin reductase-like flavin-dependent oxidoreductase (luciferase family)|nr:LLM class flavin-dependent oxidoreductase [Chromatiales bacterium]
MDMPAISLAAVPGRRKTIIEFARESESRGFAGIYLPSLGDNMSLATVLATATSTITFGTSITPIYFRAPLDLAQAAAFIHEVSDGRFRFGVGIAHAPSHVRYGVSVGKPLTDTRTFVETIRGAERIGDLPPIVLATLRKKMIGLAGEIAEGMVFANASRSHMPQSLAALPAGKRADDDFFIGNMIPTCISDDEAAAAHVNRRTLTSYAALPNYRNYWREAGYEEEMDGVEAAIAAGEPRKISDHLSDRWLADSTLFGSADKVLEGLEAWYDAGIKTPILVPSSANGNQLAAIRELFELCKRI